MSHTPPPPHTSHSQVWEREAALFRDAGEADVETLAATLPPDVWLQHPALLPRLPVARRGAALRQEAARVGRLADSLAALVAEDKGGRGRDVFILLPAAFVWAGQTGPPVLNVLGDEERLRVKMQRASASCSGAHGATLPHALSIVIICYWCDYCYGQLFREEHTAPRCRTQARPASATHSGPHLSTSA